MVVALFVILALPGLISAGYIPPFSVNALIFNTSISVPEGSEVCLRCEYFLVSKPSCGFQMILSFVQEEELTESERAVASSVQFLFPEPLKRAHKSSGLALKKTIYTPSMEKDGSVLITTSFLMSADNEGSYICQMIPINLTTDGDWILTRWMHLKIRKMSILTSSPWALILCDVPLVLLVLVCCYCAMRPRRIIFKRIIIEDSRFCVTSSLMDYPNGGQVIYQPPKITVVPEKRPCFLVYQRDLYQQRKFRRFYRPDALVPSKPKRSGYMRKMPVKANQSVPDGEDGPHILEASSTTKKLDSSYCVHFLMPFDPFYEIPLSHLHVERLLGHGAFGFVFSGSADKLPGGIMGPIPVAIKTLGANTSETDVVDFVQEIEMMKFIGKHDNVIQLYATSSYIGRPVIVMEYAAKGSLANYLHKNRQFLAAQPRSLTISRFLFFAKHIVNGMVYLTSKGIVHRDLAARNVVLSKDWVAKVADFGLTRKAEFYYRMHSSGRVPLKWMAPESVFQKLFTSKSDVWSFGVLLWELFSLGESPASGVTTEDFLESLRKGLSLFSQPEFADEFLYEVLMQQCWNLQPECRPSFYEIANILSSLYTSC